MSSKERVDNTSLEKRIKELERQLELAQMKNVGLNTMIDIAEQDYKLEIRKKSAPNSRCTYSDVPFINESDDLFGFSRQTWYHIKKDKEVAK